MNGDLHCCSLFLYGEDFRLGSSEAELPNARFHLSMELRCGMKLGTMTYSFTLCSRLVHDLFTTCSRLVHGLFVEACPEDIAYDPWWVQEAGHNDIEMTHRHHKLLTLSLLRLEEFLFWILL